MTTATITALTTEFLEKLKRNVETWRDGEIDYAIFADYQQELWASIRSHGPELEDAVLLALLTLQQRSPSAPTGWMNTGHRVSPETRVAAPGGLRFQNRRFRVTAEQTPLGNQILHIAPTTSATERETAAFIYELAAELERRSGDAAARWFIWPNVFGKRVTIGLMYRQHHDLAQALAAGVVSDLGGPQKHE